ncbi:multicopper oxidase family protein [Catellatospora methionotrophica]|uniref:multicopper oxidase family protein n=1 Tax=Catellatospora methionotrophica TaxID=121620 RepID=UPI0033FECD7C
MGTWVLTGNRIDTVGKVDFTNKLTIPPLATSTVDAQGRRVFDLTAQEGIHDFGSGRVSPAWGFNGSYLGPTLRAKAGEQVVVNVKNTLSQQTTVHWHGMHLPAVMDGGPHQQVAPGATWSPNWVIDQPASTLWYHPHLHGETAAHVYKGLAGMFILDDPAATSLALPQTYGVDDIPLIVQDKAFGDDGKLTERTPFLSGVGILGDEIAVNGTHSPYLDVTTRLVRLRILNGSNARVFNFGFSDDRPFNLIGTDGGLLEKPASMNRIQLASGERAEIVVAVTPGDKTVLRSYDPDQGTDFDALNGGADTFDVLELRAAATLAPAPDVPAALVPIDRLSPDDAKVTRKFSLSGHSINGKQMDMNRIDFAAQVDTTEIWEVFNNDGDPHSFHVHDVQFQVLTLNGAPPPAQLTGWKDTIFVPSDTYYRVIMRFTDYTDPDIPYMYHCHVLYHEDAGMMGQFAVVKPGQAPGRPPAHRAGTAHGGH